MAGIKSLAKDTAIYGVSSILGRFLNWCFVFLYINALESTAEYGIVTNLYAYMALLVIVLTYGMETGFFRFANDATEHSPQRVYTTGLISVGFTTALFFVGSTLFLEPISVFMGYAGESTYVWMLVLIVSLDVLTALPFAYLRYENKSVRFAALKMLGIFLNIALNLFFILLCPYLYRVAPQWVSWFFDPQFLVGYIFVSNIISSAVTLLVLLPQLWVRYTFDGALLKRMLRYSFPILILGIAGVMNQSLDKMLYPLIAAGRPEAMAELGIYGAVYKIAIVMVMFTQAFRYAYEPFIFAQHKRGEGGNQSYIEVMKYFVILGLLIFLAVVLYLPLVRFFMPTSYYEGFSIVPIVLLGEFCFAITFNLSVWYKLTDKTAWGAYLSLFGFLITLVLNVAFVPRYGYVASAWATLICYFAMMVLSYVVGRRYYPIAYDLRSALTYTLLTGVLWGAGELLTTPHLWLNMGVRTLLLLLFVAYVIKKDIPLHSIPYLNRLNHGKK